MSRRLNKEIREAAIGGSYVRRILAGLDQSELARLARVHITTIVRLESFDADSYAGNRERSRR